MSAAPSLPWREPVTSGFFLELKDEEFLTCVNVMKDLRSQVLAHSPDAVPARFLQHFRPEEPAKSLQEVWEAFCDSDCVLAGPKLQLQNLLECACTCSRVRPLELRKAALDVWSSGTIFSDVPVFLECSEKLLDSLMLTLLHNMSLAEEDFLKEPPEVLEDPALVELLKVRSREGLDMEEVKRASTARQRAALALDDLAIRLGEPVLTRVLPMIRSKLAEEAWELRELAVLALGAVATAMEASPLLNLDDVKAVLSACNAPPGLLRCTALWSSSRFVPHLVDNQAPEAQELLDEMRRAFFSQLQDSNDKVKTAAYSTVAVLLENNANGLAQHEDWILQEMMKGISSLGRRDNKALPALCDSVATMFELPASKRLKTAGCLVAELTAQLDSTSDSMAACIFETLSTFAQCNREEFQAFCPQITRHALRVMHNGLHPAPAGAPPARTALPEVEDGIPVLISSITGATLVSGRLQRDLTGAELCHLASQSLNGRQCKLVGADQLLPEHFPLAELVPAGGELLLTAIVVPTHDAVRAGMDCLETMVEALAPTLCGQDDYPWAEIIVLTVDSLEPERKMSRDVQQSAYCLLGTLGKSCQEVLDAPLRPVLPRLLKLLTAGIRDHSHRSVCNNAIFAALEFDKLFARAGLSAEQLASLGAALQDVVTLKSKTLHSEQRCMAFAAWICLAARSPVVSANLDVILPSGLREMRSAELDPECCAGLVTVSQQQPQVLVKHFEELVKSLSAWHASKTTAAEASKPHFRALLNLCRDAMGDEWEANLPDDLLDLAV